MRHLQGSAGLNETVLTASSGVHGLADWILKLLSAWRGQRETTQRQLRLVELLPLGGKRQLMLVTCAGESFLVGGGVDSIETIVRLTTEMSLDTRATGLDAPCR
ncbi:flagellar biosynthetic protein FliO [Tunturiibacter lichenicola]|jgi:flagellar biogenesis protein FliO|uniref:flagellar biosynthetic protein FliO n=1 Tax=Tunturiibacter lichenicola TaxID=2051959 RepID=UPI003D9B3852